MRKEKIEKGDECSEEKPQPPADEPFDEDQVRRDVLAEMLESLPPPGESPVQLLLEHVPVSFNNDRERRRLELAEKCQFQLKLSFNGEEKALSRTFNLSADFTADIQETFGICIDETPRQIAASIFFSSKKTPLKRWTLLTQFDVPIPSENSSFGEESLTPVAFSSTVEQAAIKDIGAVGCGGISVVDGEVVHVAGSVSIQSGWGCDSSGKILAPKLHTTNNVVKTGGSRSFDEWISQLELDPNDPSNVQFYDKFEATKTGEKRNDEINLNGERTQAIDDFELCTAEELDNICRKMIAQKSGGPSQPILSVDDEKASVEETNPLDELRRERGRRLQNIYLDIFNLLSSTKAQLRLSDLLIEDDIPNFGSLSSQMLPILKPHRPLRPIRKDRSVPLPAMTIHTTEDVSLRVNIIRAQNVPFSKSKNTVHPFVEVSFQQLKTCTTAGNGSTPTWNQELVLPIKLADGLRSLSSLQSIRDDLFIQLFDQVVVDLVDDDRERDTSVHQRYERHWLGGFTIPFSSIYKWSKIEGTVALEMPLVPIGYEHSDPCYKLEHSGTLLTVLISLNPSVAAPRSFQPDVPSLEDEDTLTSIQNWFSVLQKDFAPHSDRLTNPLVLNSQGKTVYIGRYLIPLQPPPQLAGTSEEETLNDIIRFVASIPSANVHFPLPSTRVWLTCQDTLELLNSGEEGRSVLLANYLMGLNYETYLAFGLALPQGESVQVLFKLPKDDTFWLLDSSTGRKTNVKDCTGSMQQLWALVNQDNFWVNVQPVMHPSRTSYQLSKASDWRPLYSRRFPNQRSETVQSTDVIRYVDTDVKEIARLEHSIANHLKQSFMKWRKTRRTRWNRHGSHVFRDILHQLARGSPLPTSPDLQQLSETFKIFGVSLRVAYSNMENLSDLLYATGLHRHHGTEFTLSVYIHSFPNDIFEVFIHSSYLENIE